MAKRQVARCSCEESWHLREALRKIRTICVTMSTGGGPADDLAQIANLSDQGLKLEPLVGDPAVPTRVPR